MTIFVDKDKYKAKTKTKQRQRQRQRQRHIQNKDEVRSLKLLSATAPSHFQVNKLSGATPLVSFICFLIRLMLIRVLIDELMVMIFILVDIEHNTLYNHVLHQYEYHQLKASRALSFGLWFMRNGSSMYN